MMYEQNTHLHDEIRQIKSKRQLEQFLRTHAKNLSRTECTHLASNMWAWGEAERKKDSNRAYVKAIGEGWRDIVQRFKSMY